MRHTASLAAFNGDALTDLPAGFAANSMGSFVNSFHGFLREFNPLRASVAGLCTTDFHEARNDELSKLVQLLVADGRHLLDEGFHVRLRDLRSFAIALNSWFLVIFAIRTFLCTGSKRFEADGLERR